MDEVFGGRIARGTDAPGTRNEFRICIRYREPTYTNRDTPYRCTFTVAAVDVEQAKAMAIAEFEELARRSSVSHPREITEVGVEEA